MTGKSDRPTGRLKERERERKENMCQKEREGEREGERKREMCVRGRSDKKERQTD